MMCNRTITSWRGSACASRSATVLAAMLLAATHCGLASTRPAAAHATYYADLSAAVADLTSRPTENDRLASKQVLVNAHDFFEEGTGRNLALSKSLRERFGTDSRSVVDTLDEMCALAGCPRGMPAEDRTDA